MGVATRMAQRVTENNWGQGKLGLAADRQCLIGHYILTENIETEACWTLPQSPYLDQLRDIILEQYPEMQPRWEHIKKPSIFPHLPILNPTRYLIEAFNDNYDYYDVRLILDKAAADDQ